MQETEYVFDLHRILLGKLPWFYLVEVFLRTTVIYVYALFVVRILGKRGMGQLAPFDFVIIIALGSAVGDPMFYPNVPLLHAMVAITAIVVFTRGLVHVSQRSRKVKDLISTTSTRLVCDGRLVLADMAQEGISRSELFEALRTGGIEHLGEVERAYLEPSGKISVFKASPGDTPPGIPVLPEVEEREVTFHHEGETVLTAGRYGCWRCGWTLSLTPGNRFLRCERCERSEWIRAHERVREHFRAKAEARSS
jgi:uncharacterized membrane protein YcaP (DUF421 family)